MSDIVERLKYMAGIPVAGTWGEACNEAAAEIEQLRAALRAAAQREAKLREALEKIANGSRDADATYPALLAEVRREARAAINPSRPSLPGETPSD